MTKYNDEYDWRAAQISSCEKVLTAIDEHIEIVKSSMEDDFDGTKDRYISAILRSKKSVVNEMRGLVNSEMIDIDIDFDFYTDTPKDKDPDSFSPTLRRYHCELWSKSLPSGSNFHLNLDVPKLLHHKSELGEYLLSSDCIGHDYSNVKKMSQIIGQLEVEEIKEFSHICSTIGAYVVFPSKRIDNQMTINGARGCNSKIQDRFDLTLECIRRFYLGEPSPLTPVLERYSDFFHLFSNFKGYVDFFLLQDLVINDYNEVNFWLAFDNFSRHPLPRNLSEYLDYRIRVTNFIKLRNQRISRSITS